MRTNIVLNEELVTAAKRLSGIRTTRGVVQHALAEMVRHRRQREILALRGAVAWEGDLRAMRRLRTR